MKNKALTLTIVIPAYNEEDYLPGCLQAIANQIEPPDEVIVVDNNSTDRTAEIATSFPFVTLLHEKKQGLRAARTAGVHMARGDIIGRIDADTRLGPNWCKVARQTFADTRTMGAVGPVSCYDMPAEGLVFWVDRWMRSVLYAINRSPVLYGSNMAFRRSAWDDVHETLCVEGEFYEDYDLTIHLRAKNHQLVYSPRMRAAISARRLDDSFRQFTYNMSFHTKTFAQHNQNLFFPKASQIIYLSLYPPLKMLRKIYRPRKLPSRAKQPPRPNSNT